MIETNGLSKRYGDRLAVDGLTFTVRPGVVTGFLGPNGAGKSTTMRMMLGLDAPSAGAVTVNGRAYRELRAPLREVGALLDARAMHGGRTARDHLGVAGPQQPDPRRRVEEVLGLVGLAGVAGRRAKGFLLGMSQRLGIAAALLGDPGWWCSTSRSTGSTPRVSPGSAGCCGGSPARAARSLSPAIC